MATFQKVVEFKAWQFKIDEQDLRLNRERWDIEANQEDDLTEHLPTLSVRKFSLIDNNEADSKPHNFPTRFRVVIYESDYDEDYGNQEGCYFNLNEGEWLVECGESEGYKVVTNEKLRQMILI